MNKIFVPTDFSQCADYALSAAIEMCKKSGAELHIGHCYNPGSEVIGAEFSAPFQAVPSTMSGEQLHELIAMHTNRVKTHLEERKKMCQERGIDPTTHIITGSMNDQLMKKIEELAVSLIIMGSHGVERIEDQLLGSNAQRMVRLSSAPVLTIKNPLSLERMVKVAFFSTFSDEGERKVFSEYKELFKNLVGHTSFVFVNTPGNFKRTKEIKERMDSFSLESWPSHYDFSVYNDLSFEDGVSSFCADNGVDIALFATHGHTGFQRLLHRSATEHVLNHTELPVLSWHLKN